MFTDGMNTKDAVNAKFAEVFAKIDGKRYSVMMCKKFEAKANISTKEVPVLGNPVVGVKAVSVKIPFTMTIYKCTEIFDDIVYSFIKNGVMPGFEIQVSNEDPATSVGRSTKTYNDCVLDGDILLSLADSEGNFIGQEISGYANGYTSSSKFTNPDYM